MGTRITDQIRELEARLQACRSDPDWPELLRLAGTAGLAVDMPRVLAYYSPGYGIDLERAREELGDG